MSTNNIQALYEKAQNDRALQQKLLAIEQAARQEYAEGIARLAEQAGTPFTAEEFLATTAAAQELSEEELSGVAGGIYASKVKGGLAPIHQQPSQHDNRPALQEPTVVVGLNPNYKK